jgi:micrococcal nuclease
MRLLIFFTALLLLVACSREESRAQMSAHTSVPTLSGTVTRVIDGDTVESLLDNGSSDTIRLLGVDTPETYISNQPGEYGNITDTVCLDKWGYAATQFTKERLDDQKVTLISDPAAGERGSFGRLLAYVQIDEVDFNALLVDLGYARVYTEGTASREQKYLRLQENAQREKRGLWECERPTPAPTKFSAGRNCDPSYPDVCIPSYPPDLDCNEIKYSKFAVLQPDRHGFDMDKDGIGCE